MAPLRRRRAHRQNRHVSVDHYENFPVASLLCPPALRPAVRAIYRFARTADDIADEGEQPASVRIAELQAYRAELAATACGAPPAPRWAQIFGPLDEVLRRYHLPLPLLHSLLDAFEQDCRNPRYPDRAALLDYCRRSANPIGRLLLHLYRIDSATALDRADAICSGLQLVNFWQDLGVDVARGRIYLPLTDLATEGLTVAGVAADGDGPALRRVVSRLCDWARELLHEGAPLAHSLPGRIGWEMRLVVAGGLRVLEKIDRMDHATLLRRPTLGAGDAAALLWRALRLPPVAPPRR